MYWRLKSFIILHKLKLAIICIGIYFVVGCLGNWYATPFIEPTPKFVYILFPSLLLFLYGALLYSIFGIGRTIEEWGFTPLDNKSLYITGLTIILLFFVGATHGIIIPTKGRFDFTLGVLGASAEELYFRVLLISIILRILTRSHHKGWWAVVGSSIIFTIPHLFSRGWGINHAIENAFPMGLILGYVFYKTRSILFPVVVHVTSNTYNEGGILGGLAFTVFYFALVLGKRIIVKHKAKDNLLPLQASEGQ